MQPIKSPANLRKQKNASQSINNPGLASEAIRVLRHVVELPYASIAHGIGRGEMHVRKMEKGEVVVTKLTAIALTKFLTDTAASLSHKDFDFEPSDDFNQAIINYLDELAESIK